MRHGAGKAGVARMKSHDWDENVEILGNHKGWKYRACRVCRIEQCRSDATSENSANWEYRTWEYRYNRTIFYEDAGEGREDCDFMLIKNLLEV